MVMEGMVVMVIYLMCVFKSVPAMAGAKLVVSESGDILSPKYAPESTAPAVIAGSKPNPLPIPIKAIPIVALVVQELPVAIETTIHTNTQATKKIVGFKICNP